MARRILVWAALLVVIGGVGLSLFFYWKGHRVGDLPGDVLVLPSDTVVLAGLDVRQIVGSNLYKKMKAQTGLEPFEEVRLRTGFDPEGQVDQIFLSLAAAGAGRGPKVLGVAVGRFDARRLDAHAEKVATRGQHEGVTVYRLNVNPASAVAVADAKTLVFGAPGRVEAFLTDRAKARRPLAGNAALDLARRVKPGTNLWVVGADALADELKRSFQEVPMMPDLGAVTGLTLTASVDPSLDLELVADTRDADAADGMAKLLGGLVALTKIGAGAQEQGELQALTSAVTVSSEENHVRIRAQLPADTVEGTLFDALRAALIRNNEARALADVRRMVDVQRYYQSLGRGGFGEMKCLAAPQSCVPGYDGPPLVDAIAERSGYRRALHLGPRRDTFAFTAVPLVPGRTGERAFCSDDTGLFCAGDGGAEAGAAGGRCPAGCTPLF